MTKPEVRYNNISLELDLCRIYTVRSRGMEALRLLYALLTSVLRPNFGVITGISGFHTLEQRDKTLPISLLWKDISLEEISDTYFQYRQNLHAYSPPDTYFEGARLDRDTELLGIRYTKEISTPFRNRFIESWLKNYYQQDSPLAQEEIPSFSSVWAAVSDEISEEDTSSFWAGISDEVSEEGMTPRNSRIIFRESKMNIYPIGGRYVYRPLNPQQKEKIVTNYEKKKAQKVRDTKPKGPFSSEKEKFVHADSKATQNHHKPRQI